MPLNISSARIAFEFRTKNIYLHVLDNSNFRRRPAGPSHSPPLQKIPKFELNMNMYIYVRAAPQIRTNCQSGIIFKRLHKFELTKIRTKTNGTVIRIALYATTLETPVGTGIEILANALVRAAYGSYLMDGFARVFLWAPLRF